MIGLGNYSTFDFKHILKEMIPIFADAAEVWIPGQLFGQTYLPNVISSDGITTTFTVIINLSTSNQKHPFKCFDNVGHRGEWRCKG